MYGGEEVGRHFNWPYIVDESGDDDDDGEEGSVLIAVCDSDRLKVMTEQGEFRRVKLQPPVSQPRGAVLFNGCLYVTSCKDKTLSQYVCEVDDDE